MLSDYDTHDADVPVFAVRALAAANRRAHTAGYALVFVQDDNLVRLSDGHIFVLKQLRPRKKVSQLFHPTQP